MLRRRKNTIFRNIMSGTILVIIVILKEKVRKSPMILFYVCIQTAGYEQRKWEEEHLQQATLKFGAKDAKARHKEKEKDYEYILDDEIEFVQALKMPGTKVSQQKSII